MQRTLSSKKSFVSDPDLLRLGSTDSSNSDTNIPLNLNKSYDLVMQYAALGNHEKNKLFS